MKRGTNSRIAPLPWTVRPDSSTGVRLLQQTLATRSVAAREEPFAGVLELARTPLVTLAAVTDVLSRKSADTPGIDGVTRVKLASLGDDEVAAEIAARLETSPPRWASARAVTIPKTGGARTLLVPTLADRMAERALLLVLAPIVEPRMAAESHGFRFSRGPQTALDAVLEITRNLRTKTILETDISSFFPGLRHVDVATALARHASDEELLSQVSSLMTRSRAGSPRATRGLPQGGPLSPLLANLAFDDADRFLRGLEEVVGFVRYADDLFVGVDGDVEAGERVLMRFEHFLKGRFDLQVARTKTFVRPVGEKSSCLGHSVWRSASGEAEIEPLPDRVERLRQKLATISQEKNTKKEVGSRKNNKNSRMSDVAAGWAGYYRPRHHAQQLANAVLAEVQGRAKTSSPPSLVGPSASLLHGIEALSGPGDSDSLLRGDGHAVRGIAKVPFSSGGAATNSRPEHTGDQDRSCAAPTRTETRNMDCYDGRMAKVLSAMENLSGLTGDALVDLLAKAVTCFAEVKSDLATVQVELLPLTDRKRRRIVFLRNTALSEALQADFPPSWRERTYHDAKVTELVDRIRELEADKVRLDAEREICDRVMRTLGYAIERRSGKA